MKYNKEGLNRIHRNAAKLGVKVIQSPNPNKKFDVYSSGKYKTSIGDSKHMDYHLYRQKDRREAEKRRDLYFKCHANNIKVKHSPGYYAAWTLWN